jgi:hypothetical protein
MMDGRQRLGQTTEALVYLRGRLDDAVNGASIAAVKKHIAV